MILLRRRHKPNILSDYIDKIRNEITVRQDRILKLDKRHLNRHAVNISNGDVGKFSFHPSLRREMELASVVMYKEDWNNNDCKLTVLKFRFDNKELTTYINVIKDMTICYEINNYNKNGNEMSKVRFYRDHYEETFL